ncbi:MAG: YceI family protein [Haliscomenobacter sp.]|nr:YceI family protein [Haliscomenobacter sp.]MBK8878864.1 YceI family protein [Haliscomenobacter sp.]
MLFSGLMVFIALTSGFAQGKFFSREGHIFFDATSNGSPEVIEANNRAVSSVIDLNTGQMEFAALIKSFRFERALMEEHFNENYLESTKFPKAVFKGKITDLKAINLGKDGSYPVKVTGTLTMHGETKPLTVDASLTVKGGKITLGKSSFSLTLADYKIKIPSLVSDKVASVAKVTIDVPYQPLADSK